MTMLYCIGTDDGFIKVGLSENPVGRLSQLQIGNHRKLTLLHPGPNYDGASSITPECDPNAIEREVHEALRYRHARGEWFFGTLETFEKAVEVVQYSDTIFRKKPEGWKPPKKSTAARKDVRGLTTNETQGSALPVVARNLEATDGSPGAPNQTAGTQAPPVDTPKRGRPRIHPDRKAYKAEWERKRRAKRKEQK